MSDRQEPSTSDRGRFAVPDPSCLCCERMRSPRSLEERRVYQDELFHLSHQRAEEGTQYLGVGLIPTQRHATGLAELSDTESARLGALIGKASRALKCYSDGAWTDICGFTESTRHVHGIVAARYPGPPPDFVRRAVTDWPDAPTEGAPRRRCPHVSSAWRSPGADGDPGPLRPRAGFRPVRYPGL